MRLRLGVELIGVAVAGLVALAAPVLTGAAPRGRDAAFLSVMADVVHTIDVYSLAFLFGVGVLSGVLAKAPPLLLGFGSVSLLLTWSVIDFAMGGAHHTLLPIEWAFYCVFGLVASAGAIIGRNRGLKRRSNSASVSNREHP